MSNNRDMTKIRCYLAILVLQVPLMSSGPKPPENICNNIDPETRHENLDLTNFEIDKLNSPSSSQDVSEAQINSLLAKLDDPDPKVRIDSILKLYALCKTLPWNLQSRWLSGLEYQLRKEKDVFVITAIMKSLFAWGSGSRIRNELQEVVLCDRDEPLRELAIDQAVKTSDLGILMALWEKHPTPSNAEKICPVAMKMLKQGFAYGYDALEKIGRAPTAEEVNLIYSTGKLFMSKNRKQMLQLLERLGEVKSTALLEEAFEQVNDPSIKRNLAQVILRSQLEPNKPQYPDWDAQPCVPREETLAKRLRYIEKEIKRLVRSYNTRYFEQAYPNEIHPVMSSFDEWGYSLKDPKARIMFWEQVLSILPQNSKDLRKQPLRQLLIAHASYGGQLMLTDRKAAKHEIELAESLGGEVQMAAEFPGILEKLKHWIERKPEPPSINSGDLIGKYSAGGFFGSYTLILKEGNKYDFTAHGDSIRMCPIQPTQGEYLIQGRYLILIPGPHISDYYGFDGPEFMVPVIWDKNVFLLRDNSSTEGNLEFCNIVNSRKDSLKSMELWSYHKTRDPMKIDDELKGNPSLPEEWKDCILDEPLKPEVIKVEEKSALVVNMGKDDGLRVGMKLYLDNSALLAIWRISEVSAKDSHAIPFGDTPAITLGEKLSTRVP